MTQTIMSMIKENTLDTTQDHNILLTFFSFFGIALIFGYLIAHISLKPTREALASQKQFIGNIAHELRTPLSIIKTNMEVTLLEGGLDKKIRESITGNVDELDRTSDIINNLLSFNTLQNPEHITFNDIDLGKITTRVIDKLTPLAKERNVDISLQKGEFLTVTGNASAIEQIVLNIIKNSLAYTESGGWVDVSIAPNYRGYIELCVSDNGTGISHKNLFRIFEPFYRAEQSRAKKHGGSGLGLTIVSELVKLHSGKISIKSKESRGTVVLIALPCGQPKITPPLKETDGDVIARDFSKHKNPVQKKKQRP